MRPISSPSSPGTKTAASMSRSFSDEDKNSGTTADDGGGIWASGYGSGSEFGGIAHFDNAPDRIADIGIEAEGATAVLTRSAVEEGRIAVEQVSHCQRNIVAAHEAGIEGIAQVQVQRGPGLHGIATASVKDAVGGADHGGRTAAHIGVGPDIIHINVSRKRIQRPAQMAAHLRADIGEGGVEAH